jgi:hypothetical protein
MSKRVKRQTSLSGAAGDAGVLALVAFGLLAAVHLWMGNGYGFHRDELQFLDDARHLHWGFAAYPPMTSFCGRVAIALFGISPQVLRLPAMVLNSISLVLTGLIARELGGKRWAQITALLAALASALVFSSVLQYNTPDLLAWNLLALGTACVLRRKDARWWLLAGAGVGLGVLSKYTIALPTVSLLAGLLVLPTQRHYLRNRWFWAAVGLTLLIASPNLIWLVRHDFLTLRMEQFIHARDVRNGRAEGFFTDQLKFTLFGFAFALAGLVSLLRDARFRLLSALYLGPLVLLVLTKGRGYYLMPGYPVLYAAGAVALERALHGRGRALRVGASAVVLAAAAVESAAVAWTYLPVWPVGSPAWNWQMANNEDMANEVGWPEFVAQVAAVRDGLPPADKQRLAVLANNFGEAGALELYGPRYGLPLPISSVNSFHDRGYGPYQPETLIVVGSNLDDQLQNFTTCRIVARVHLPYGVQNEETKYHPQILVCHRLRGQWDVVWARSQEFG